MVKRALIVIDVQKYYINEHTKKLPGKIAKFLENNKFDFVLFMKFANNENSSLSKHLGWKDMQSSPDIDICDELAEFIKKDNLFQKNTYSIFKCKPFSDFLAENNIEELILCGFDTDACVLSSAYEAFDLGYKVKVIEELTQSHDGKKIEECAMNIINKNLQ